MAVVNIFMHHLSMAICEWFLMFLMFFDATLGFILTKFAHHCELQTPCLFCFKFDHVFGEKPGYYLNFFCKKHRDEVSCLITCEIHEKLADVREMCDDCFMSIMKQNEFSKPYLNKNFVRKPSSLGLCSCCKIQWKPKPKPKPPMQRVTGRAKSRGSFRRRNNFKRVRDRISGTSSTFYIGEKIHMDSVSDSGCADFYSGSDSESEDSFYEIDCGETECYEPSFRKGSPNGSDKNGGYEYSETRSVGEHDVEKLDEPREREGYGYSETHSVGEIETDMEKLNGSHNGLDKHEGYEYSETHSVMDGENNVETINSPRKGSDKHDGYEYSETHSVGEMDVKNVVEKIQSPHNGSDKHYGYGYPETHSVGEMDVENVVEKTQSPHNGSDKHEGYEYSKTHSAGEIFGENEVEKIKSHHNGSDKHKGYEYSETYRVVGEMDVENFVEKVQSTHDGSDKYEGYEYSETHSAGEMDGENDVDKISSPRNGSDKHEGYEYSETHSVSEIDGENDVEILKRKLENEQQRLRLLHKELEEERNASAISADEAMAMITRLQEEKAALHMEASQYLRMMDEQAEYDMDALDKANDLVAEKDKEIQDLEAELEYFRNRYENELFNGNFKSFKKSKSVLGLEDEKKYILQSLSELERKYHQNYKDSMDLNGGESEVDVENEIAGLNERLEALESDRDFIEHACNMVESHGGVQFIQEIAQHLRDLRRARLD